MFRYQSVLIVLRSSVRWDCWECFALPTDIQFKDELRKEEIKLEEQIEMLKNKEYDKMLAKFERELKRVRESLQD